jgi:flavodoxin
MVVLVAYATRFGAARSIAERIAARLREHGHQVVVHATDRPIDAAVYDAVVVGSSVYNQAWLPAAAEFLRHNLDALAGRPVWVFSVGGLASPGRWARIGARKYPQKVRGFRGYVLPRTTTISLASSTVTVSGAWVRFCGEPLADGSATSGTGRTWTRGLLESPKRWREPTIGSFRPDKACGSFGGPGLQAPAIAGGSQPPSRGALRRVSP